MLLRTSRPAIFVSCILEGIPVDALECLAITLVGGGYPMHAEMQGCSPRSCIHITVTHIQASMVWFGSCWLIRCCLSQARASGMSGNTAFLIVYSIPGTGGYQ